MMDLVSWTFSSGGYDQDKAIYIDCYDPTKSLSARQTKRLVKQMVSGLQKYGIAIGDCVCIHSFNSIYYPALYLGIIGSGCIFTGANPGYTVHELTHHLQMTNAKYIFTASDTIDTAVAAAEKCNILQENIFVLHFHEEEVPSGYKSWRSLLECGTKDWLSVSNPADQTAVHASTSGTSGLPKAAMLSHAYMTFQGETHCRTLSSNQDVSYLIALPPFHVFTIPPQHLMPLRLGVPTYVMPRFDLSVFITSILSFKITHTLLVPPMLMALSKSEACDKDSLKSIKRIFVAGSAAGDGMQQQLYAKLGRKAKISHAYGMTEAGWAAIWQDSKRDSTGSVGTPVEGTELRLMNPETNELITTDNTKGEIHIRSPYPMAGYLNNISATAEAFTTDGWIRSGDVGYVVNGNYHVIDRTKDLIKVRGWQVSPAEIETTLLEHASIADAGVIGISTEDGTSEVPRAFVVRKEGGKLDEEAVKIFLKERLSSYKMVESVEFVDRIPRNPTGKILRRVLREMAAVGDEGQKKIFPDVEVAEVTDTQEDEWAIVVKYKRALQELELWRKQGKASLVCSTCRKARRNKRNLKEFSEGENVDSRAGKVIKFGIRKKELPLRRSNRLRISCS